MKISETNLNDDATSQVLVVRYEKMCIHTRDMRENQKGGSHIYVQGDDKTNDQRPNRLQNLQKHEHTEKSDKKLVYLKVRAFIM